MYLPKVLKLALAFTILLCVNTQSFAQSIKNIVLVHGAFVDASIWNGVISRLQGRGFNVYAVQLPLSSLNADVSATQAVLDRVEGPTILVGYSWGGVPVTITGTDSKVTGLVYFAAVTPEPGESLGEMLKPYDATPMPGASALELDSNGYYWLDREQFGFALAHDAPTDVTRVMAATEKPTAASIFEAKPDRAAWQTKPSWYVISTQDKIFPVELQHKLAKKIGASVSELPTGHASILSEPSEAASVIINAAKSLAD